MLSLAVAGSVLASLGLGFASAIVPVVNAEVAAGALTRLPLALALCGALMLAAGQTLGKVLLFEAGRRGKQAAADRSPGRSPAENAGRLQQWRERALERMSGRWSGNGVVLLSAGLGLPPLAVVAVTAGMTRQRRTDFAVCCFAGRAIRFLAVVGAVAFVW